MGLSSSRLTTPKRENDSMSVQDESMDGEDNSNWQTSSYYYPNYYWCENKYIYNK